MNKTKNLFSILLIMMIILSALPPAVYAAPGTPEISSVTTGEGTNSAVYANGTALIVADGGTDGCTTIYIDTNANGILDSGEQSLASAGVLNAPTDDSDLSLWFVFGGATTAYAGGQDYTGDTLVTVTGGKIRKAYANGFDTNVIGSATLNLYGGEVTGEASIGTCDVSGNKTINVKGNTKVNSLWIAQCTGGRATIVGELTAGANIGITCPSSHTVIAQTAAGVDKAYADASKFHLTFLGNYSIFAGTGSPQPLGVLYLSANAYTLTYQLKGGTAGTNTPTNAVCGTAFAVSAPTKADCTFLGWQINCIAYPASGAFAKYGDSAAGATNSLTYGTNVYKNSLNAANDVWFIDLSSINGAEITLTAVWSGPITSVVISNPTPHVGDVLTATITPSYADVTYSWKSGGNVVSTAASYTVVNDDLGKIIELTVNGTGNYTGSAQATPTSAVTMPQTDASLTPNTAAYDKNTAVGGLVFTLYPGTYTLTAIKGKSVSLTPGTDYTVNGNICTITQAYLGRQAEGELRLEFIMSGGVNPTAVITISNSSANDDSFRTPKTADHSAIIFPLFCLIISGIGILFIKRRFRR